MIKYVISLALLCCSFSASTQETTLQGVVIDALNREPVQDATVLISSGNYATTDNEGAWHLNVEPGIYNIEISHINFDPYIVYEKRARPAQQNVLEIELQPSLVNFDEVTINSAKISRSAENGNSIKTLEIDEIQRMPGAVMDISKVIKNFPGVSPRVSFGYNIIVRGGASFENRFFLDGIEIPAITHFNVQGLSGGPNGAINTDLISRATFKSGSFPVNRDNALSSVLDLEQKTGRRDRFGTKLTLGAAEYGAHLEGPMTKYSSYILSVRKSYTEYLLRAFNLPVLPAFTDFQYKQKIWLPNKDQLTFVGFGTYDQYRLNLGGEATDALLYNVGYIPEGDQNTTVFGANYKHFTDNGSFNMVVSHNRFFNRAWKYEDNSGLEEDQTLDYNSTEIETKFRLESNTFSKKSKFNYGASYDLATFTLDQFSLYAPAVDQLDTLNVNSRIDYQKFGFFSSYSYEINDKWNIFIGARLDGNTLGSEMNNPFSQFSPRLSIQRKINSKLSATLQSGIYYQLPPSALLAYQEEGELVNIDRLKYIRSAQASFGIDYQVNKYRRLNFDVFYKNYDQYPFLLRDSISFANANGEYVTVGNQAADASSVGRAYGVEFFFQQKLFNTWFSNISSTYVVSEFADRDGSFIPSAWDSRFFLNLTLGKELRKNWTIGAKFTYAGSNPYTPYDVERSSNIVLWDANRRGVFDFDAINSERLPAFHSLDFRVDKKWYKNNMTIIAFLDLQNLYNNKFELVPYLIVNRNDAGDNIVLDSDPSRYQTEIINSDTGRVLPTIGLSFEF